MAETPKPEQENSKEVLNLPPVYFIYRDNDLFEGTIPEVINSLRNMGHRVEVQVFTRETSHDEISKWLDKHSADFADKIIIRDNTVDSAPSKDSKETYREGMGKAKSRYYLDDLVNKAATDSIDDIGKHIFGEDAQEALATLPKRDERSRELAEKAIPLLLSRILEDSANKPEYVGILSDKLLDHSPLSEFTNETEAINKIKEWLIQVGIPEDIIKDAKLERPSNTIKTAWYIMDRHAEKYKPGFIPSTGVHMYNDRKLITLSLPLGSMFDTAQRSGLLRLRPEENSVLQDSIKQQIETVITPKTK